MSGCEWECKQIRVRWHVWSFFLGGGGINDLKYLLLYWVWGALFRDLCVYGVYMCSTFVYECTFYFLSFLFNSASPIKIEFHSSLSIQFKQHTHIHTQSERNNHSPMVYLIRTNFMHIHLTLLLHVLHIYIYLLNILNLERFFAPFSLTFWHIVSHFCHSSFT